MEILSAAASASHKKHYLLSSRLYCRFRNPSRRNKTPAAKSPNQPLARVADYTAGHDFHVAPKNFSYLQNEYNSFSFEIQAKISCTMNTSCPGPVIHELCFVLGIHNGLVLIQAVIS